MATDRKPERLRAVADICARMAAPGVVDRLGTVGCALMGECIAEIARGVDPLGDYRLALETISMPAGELCAALAVTFGPGAP